MSLHYLVKLENARLARAIAVVIERNSEIIIQPQVWPPSSPDSI